MTAAIVKLNSLQVIFSYKLAHFIILEFRNICFQGIVVCGP